MAITQNFFGPVGINKEKLLRDVKNMSDSREHVTNDHFLGYEDAITEVVKLIEGMKAK